MLFRQVIGQTAVKNQLLAEIKEARIPHARLFCGPEGVGKLPLALAYARYLCCTNKQETDACGTCSSCVKFNKLVHPDVHFVFPVVKNAKKKKELCDDYLPEWRAFLIEHPYFTLSEWLDEMEAENSQALIYARESDEIIKKIQFKSGEGGYKFVIMPYPEKMHTVCANKLLKILEEPPEKTVFLLLTDTPDRLLPTILSRVWSLHVPKIAADDIAGTLCTRFGLDEAVGRSLARQADGSLAGALKAMSLNEEQKLFFDHFVSLMRLAYQRKVKEMTQWSEQAAAMGRERQKSFLNYCQRSIRENFISNLHQPDLVYLTPDEQNFAARFAPFVNERNTPGLMRELALAQQHIEQNVNAKMVFFDFALKMIVLLKQ